MPPLEQLAHYDLQSAPPRVLNTAVAVAIAVGTLYCFLGYRTLKAVLAVTGFALAGLAAGVIAGFITKGNLPYMAGAAALGGIAGALALFFVYRSGVFCLGLLGVTLIAHHAVEEYGSAAPPWAVLGAGVAGGLIALWVERPVVTVATAALGAWAIVQGVLFFMNDADVSAFQFSLAEEDHRSLLATWAVLAAAGALAQFATYRPRRAKAD